ncbi:MAG: glycosyl hydrolase family 18 protein [Chloroflexota bacterium]
MALVALVAGLLVLATLAPAAPARAIGRVQAASAASTAAAGTLQPTIQYEEALAHAGDTTVFAPGDRVTVPFKPRNADHWAVGGVAPRALPAGRKTGKAIRVAAAPTAPGSGPAASAAPPAAVGAIDEPYVDPSAAIPADLAAAVDPGGLKREVYGFLPYWELTDPSTRLDWETLSTIAYFGVGAAGNGDLQRNNTDGSTTVGWSGWTSATLTSVINTAHANGTRVVLTVQSFAWSSTGVAQQKALLGSSAARANLARQIAAAVRDRGADGVNLDFEPIVATYADEFTLLVRAVRAELNKVAPGYQLTFDATGWIGNYPIELATGPTGADAVVIMGYDYKNGASNPVGSVAPLGGPGYDISDTVASYLSRIPAARLILGVPYYGRAWSTDSSLVHATNISGTKNGASTTVVYGTAVQYAIDHGRKWDPVEAVAWTSYHRENCTAAYGCVNSWREIYYDDPQALGFKYDLINRYNLRGAGIWALGYDGTRPELYQALKAKFITDKIPPVIASSSLSASIISPNGDGRLDATTVAASVTGHLTFGWLVQPLTGTTAGPSVRSGTLASKTVVFRWDGRNDAGAVVPDGLYGITLWAADASDNRASVQKFVTVDRHAAVISLSATPTTISPNGDGRGDQTTLAMRSDSTISGSARLLNASGAGIRKWTFTGVGAGAWVWNGRDSAGRMVPDGHYALRVWGVDRAANAAIKDLAVTVDRTLRSVTWSRTSFVPAAKQTSRVSFTTTRAATITIAIYGADNKAIRGIWQGRALAAGTYGWTWNGRTSAGVLLKPGTYRAIVTATTWLGSTTLSKTVVLKAP